jgi:flagellar biosynthesis/type III secretory pathway M-ring protein FliF/YscJ
MTFLYYVAAIVVVCGLIVFFFVHKAIKHRKRIEKFRNESMEQTPPSTETPEEAPLAETENEKKSEADLEAFSIEEELPQEKPQPQRSERRPMPKFVDAEDDEPEDELDDEMLERRISSYERFLQEQQRDFDFDENRPAIQNTDSLMDFDFETLKGKSREEVLEMIKDLSPNVQDFIMNDIFDRKNDED